MPVVAAAVCPHPPILVPGVAGRAADELVDLRDACDEVVRRLAGAGPDQLVMVGTGPADTEYGTGDFGTLAAYGVDIVGRLGPETPTSADNLPLSLTIGGWLLGRANWRVPVSGRALPDGMPTARYAEIGSAFAGVDDRIALMVMGDGSACRSVRAPGYLHPRAEPFDRAVAAALGTADTAALTSVDPRRARQLQAAGWGPWQVLAAAAAGASWRAELLYDDAPYGVGYFVAHWERT